jgi:hypothetical protein
MVPYWRVNGCTYFLLRTYLALDLSTYSLVAVEISQDRLSNNNIPLVCVVAPSCCTSLPVFDRIQNSPSRLSNFSINTHELLFNSTTGTHNYILIGAIDKSISISNWNALPHQFFFPFFLRPPHMDKMAREIHSAEYRFVLHVFCVRPRTFGDLLRQLICAQKSKTRTVQFY